MKQKIKNLFFILPSFFTFVFLFILSIIIKNHILYSKEIKIISTILIILLLLVILQILSFIILLIKNKSINRKNKIFTIIYLLLFNIFYIPIFYLKNIKNYKNYNIFKLSYLIITIILYTLSFIIALSFVFNFDKYKYKNAKYKTYNTKDNIISVTLKNYYLDKTKETNYDLYLKKDDEKAVIGILNHEINDDYSSDYYLNKYIDNIKKDIPDLKEDKKEKKYVINMYNVKEKYYSSKKENDYFVFTSITKDNKTAIILFSSNTNNIINNKDYIDLINNIKIK